MTRRVAIIQARMGSSRLPGKVLMPLAGKPSIWHSVERLKRASTIDQIVLATSTAPDDDELAAYTEANLDVGLFRGSEHDVLDRYYQAGLAYQADIVIRVTGDTPLIAIDHLDRVVSILTASESLTGVATTYRYSHLTVGFGHEAYRFSAIEAAAKKATQPEEREHVTTYLKRRPDEYPVEVPVAHRELQSDYRFALDYAEDYELLEQVYARLYREGDIVDSVAAIKLLDSDSDLRAINAHCIQNPDPAVPS